MEFGRSQEGRPQGTSEVKGRKVIHYTCNAPDEDTLKAAGIEAIGEKFKVSPREVLLMPKGLFRKKGKIGTIEAEQVLRNLG